VDGRIIKIRARLWESRRESTEGESDRFGTHTISLKRFFSIEFKFNRVILSKLYYLIENIF